MVASRNRQRLGRAYLVLVVCLTVAFGLLLGYQYFHGTHFHSDPGAMAELQQAALPEPNAFLDGEWPQWRGPHRDGVSGEPGLLTTWPAKGPRVLWSKPVGAGHATVIVTGGRAYTMMRDGDREVVVCWKADTGAEVWKKSYPGKFAGKKWNEGYGDGPRATPTLDGNFLYTMGVTGLLRCWHADSGESAWEVDLLEVCHAPMPQYGMASSPLVAGDLIFTSPGGPDGNSLAAVDKKTGKVVWHAGDDPAGYSSPILLTGGDLPQVLYFTARALVSVAPQTGEIYWTFPWETSYDCNIATPIAVGKYVFISSNYGKGCAVLEVARADNGKPKVRPVYEGTQMANHYASSVYWKENIYGFNDSRLTCMHFRTGEVVWKQGGFKKGSLMLADGHLIVLGEYGKLAVAEASPQGFKIKAEVQVTRKKCWTMPVFAEGKLFIRDEEKVICLEMKEPGSK